METVSINQKERINTVKPFLLQVSQSTGVIYTKYLRVAHEGKMIAIERLKISMPSITLRNAYEAKRKIFTTNLNLDISQQLKKLDEKEKKKPRALTQRQQETLDMLKDGYTLSRIAEEGNMSRQTAYNQLKSLRERGMSIVPIRTKGQKEPSYEVIE